MRAAAARRVERVEIPYTPRAEFMPLHDRSTRWAAIVAHRRAGKTVACVNDLIKGALTCPRPEPRFAYLAPFFAQAKDVAWSYLKHFALVVPGAEANESELRVDFPNGGRVRLYGADNYDRMRGIYLDGVVLDEFADMDPRAWSEVIRPALSDRAGWAVFIGTPKGRNAFWEIYDEATRSPDWHAMALKASETRLLSEGELADAAKSMSPEQYAQEYECSFQAAIQGAYYGKAIEAAENDNRITGVPYDPACVVHTAWDLGIGDSTAIWFAQNVGREVHIIDFIESNGVGLDWYMARLREKPYAYGEHILPHDAQARELGSGRTRVETLESLGMKGARVLPAQSVDDGINAARMLIPRCWFDAAKCKRGLEALRQYRREWDDKRKDFNPRPAHDWSSHAADAFRYLAEGMRRVDKAKGDAGKLNYQPLGYH